jgi:hypothetical protein
MEQQETQQPQPNVEAESLVLSQEEVTKTLNDETIEPEVVLPSEEFEVPDKFKGKSAEEIAKAYVELEKMKAPQPTQQEEGGDEESTSDQETIQPYIDKVLNNEELTEDEYNVLQSKYNMSKEQLDEQIDFIRYKQDKQNKQLYDSVGGKELFDSAVTWAKSTYTPEEIQAYNDALASASPNIQKVIIKGIIDQYQLASKLPQERTLHTNEAPRGKAKGYQSQHELLQDMGDPRYGNDRSYTKMVEAKMEVTDDTGWA